MKTYTITVVNDSGAQHNYTLFSESPKVTSRVKVQIWQNVLATAQIPPDSQGAFTLFEQYYAMVATSDGKPSDGVGVNVSGTKEVKLGSTASDGTLTKGTSWRMDVVEEAPSLVKELTPNGMVNAFDIVTSDTFTLTDATRFNYMIGLAGSNSGNAKTPSATFVPEPSVRYQIQPVNTYYLTYGQYTSGNIIDATWLGNVVEVDFTKLTADVIIDHDENGNLIMRA